MARLRIKLLAGVLTLEHLKFLFFREFPAIFPKVRKLQTNKFQKNFLNLLRSISLTWMLLFCLSRGLLDEKEDDESVAGQAEQHHEEVDSC